MCCVQNLLLDTVYCCVPEVLKMDTSAQAGASVVLHEY